MLMNLYRTVEAPGAARAGLEEATLKDMIANEERSSSRQAADSIDESMLQHRGKRPEQKNQHTLTLRVTNICVCLSRYESKR